MNGCDVRLQVACSLLVPSHRLGQGQGGVDPGLTMWIQTTRQREPGNLGDLMATVARFGNNNTRCSVNLNFR